MSIDLVSARTCINPYYGIQMSGLWLTAAMTAMALFCGCGKPEEPANGPAPRVPEVTAPPQAAPSADSRPAIACFGNSITDRFDDFPLWLHEGFAAPFEVVRGGRWAGFGHAHDLLCPWI